MRDKNRMSVVRDERDKERGFDSEHPRDKEEEPRVDEIPKS